MDIHIDKKRKLNELETEFPKSEIFKALTVEQQNKYKRLDPYLVCITYEDIKETYLRKENIQAYIEPYDRILFVVFLRNIFGINVY